MKTALGSFSTMLATGVTSIARCWRVERADGTVFGFTDHDRTLSFGGTDYLPESGFTRSETESRLGLQIDTMDIEGSLSADAITEADIAIGLWDDAAFTLLAVDWTDTANRVILRAGSLGEVTRGDIAFMAELRGLSHALNQEGGRTYQRLCDAVLGDARCGIDLGSPVYTGGGTVVSQDGGRIVVASGLDDYADGWFAQGLLTWATGANAGAAVEVRRHLVEDGPVVTLTLWRQAAETIAAGDTFTITAGCDKTFPTCGDKFANQVNFRGFPHIPGNDFALGVAKKTDTNDGGSFFN